MTMTRRSAGVVKRRASGFTVAALVIALLAGCTTMRGIPVAAGLDGSSSGSVQSSGPTGVSGGAPDPVADPSTRQLIAGALESGEIDEPTSWLYRTWAAFGDPLLPEQYQGAPDGHDIELFTSMPSRLGELPDDVRAQVEPYFLRPSDPKSAFNAGGDPPGLRSARSAQLPSKADKPKSGKCHDGWAAEPVPGLPFIVWTCLDMDHSDPDVTAADIAAAKIAQAAGVVTKYVGKMIADMGPVIPDDPGTDPDPRSDSRIDIYVLPAGTLGPRRDGKNHDFDDAVMVTIPSKPYTDRTASAYVIARADQLADPAKFERALVHELFHVLQYTHNEQLSSRWFYEASAEWAASYYVRYDSARLHKERLPILQNAAWTSLQADDGGLGMHSYGAYLWPLFMEQEAGPGSIFATWAALERVPKGGWQPEVISVLNKQLDVAHNFPKFVMRMYNANDLPGDPIHPRFVDLDPNFPDGMTPAVWPSWTLDDDSLDIDFTNVVGLGYYYAPVNVLPKPGEGDHGVMVTIAGDVKTLAGKLPSLEALVRGEDGDFKRKTINYQGDGEQVCVAAKMILVLANQSTDASDSVVGSIELKREKDENGKDKRCGKVEATHPETLTRLANSDDVVRVTGIEGDRKPDSVPVVITVSQVPADQVANYRVTVKLSGDTLDAPRDFTWPLSEFTPLGESGKYRKSTIVLLDRDLTDANRDFTIDARLVDDKESELSTHAPTVELHGKRHSECSFEITWSGTWTQVEFSPPHGPKDQGGLSGAPITRDETGRETGYTSGHDAQSGRMSLRPLGYVMILQDGVMMSMDAMFGDWGATLPANASPYRWTLEFGPEIYEQKTGHFDVPWVHQAGSTGIDTGMELSIEDAGGKDAYFYHGPASVDITRHEFAAADPDKAFDTNTTVGIAGTFKGTLTQANLSGDTIDVAGSFSYSYHECGG